jgi:hypothetical protein
MNEELSPTSKQKLSSSVRARLLFKREVEIDSIEHSKFNGDYLQRLIAVKDKIDQKVTKLLTSSVLTTFLLYLAGKGIDMNTPLWGLRLSEVPGVLILLSFASSYALAMSAYAFMNSQTYAALIDQVVLQETNDGMIDPELVKCGYQEEWLIFKTLRKDFSFYFPAHIKMGKIGELTNRIIFFLIATIAISPFLAMLIVQPYLSFTLLPTGWVGFAAQTFSFLCSTSVFCLVVIAQWDFECSVAVGKSPDNQAS